MRATSSVPQQFLRSFQQLTKSIKTVGAMLVLCAAALAQSQSQPPQTRAWEVLHSGMIEKSDDKRAAAALALGLIVKNAKAASMAANVLKEDEQPEVRASGAAALGTIGIKDYVPALKKATADKNVGVALEAARSLITLGDSAGYDVYYAVLTGERKPGGLMDEQLKMLRDPKQLMWLGVQEGASFVPFGGVGVGAVRALRKDSSSQVRAAAAKTLAKDPDPQTAKALVRATLDKSWVVRAAALGAIALRNDPSLIPNIVDKMDDEKATVRYAAAAAVIHLSEVKPSQAAALESRP